MFKKNFFFGSFKYYGDNKIKKEPKYIIIIDIMIMILKKKQKRKKYSHVYSIIKYKKNIFFKIPFKK